MYSSMLFMIHHYSACHKWLTESSRQTVLLSAYLVPYGFLGWEAEGVHLWKLGPQVVVELPELCVTSVHVPLVVKDAYVHLRKSKKDIINIIIIISKL